MFHFQKHKFSTTHRSRSQDAGKTITCYDQTKWKSNEIQTENQNETLRQNKTVLLPSSWNRVSDIVSLMITFYDGLCFSML